MALQNKYNALSRGGEVLATIAVNGLTLVQLRVKGVVSSPKVLRYA